MDFEQLEASAHRAMIRSEDSPIIIRSLGSRSRGIMSAAVLGAVAMMSSDIDAALEPLQGVTYGGYAITRNDSGPRFKRHRCQRNAGSVGSARGMRLRAARELQIARAKGDPKTIVVNRMTNAERTDWNRMGQPDIDWVMAEKFSRDRDYTVAL